MIQFLSALAFVTLAEMGDKTQLLAMCFASRFNWKKVMLGVFIATILNHAAAVAAGYFLKGMFSANPTITLAIKTIAFLSFIAFGLWTIKGDEVDDCENTKNKYGPVITVAIAFFLAEMGDKTQLATVSLAATFDNPIAILMGTTAGMMVADGIGIIAGVVMHKKIPENILKWVSAILFAICGMVGYVTTLKDVISIETLVGSSVLVIIISISIGWFIVKESNKSKISIKQI